MELAAVVKPYTHMIQSYLQLQFLQKVEKRLVLNQSYST